MACSAPFFSDSAEESVPAEFKSVINECIQMQRTNDNVLNGVVAALKKSCDDKSARLKQLMDQEDTIHLQLIKENNSLRAQLLSAEQIEEELLVLIGTLRNELNRIKEKDLQSIL